MFRGLSKLAISKILHVDISSEPDVVGEIPAHVIRIVIDYDLIATLIPVSGVAIVIRS
jgi:hypothetical protein